MPTREQQQRVNTAVTLFCLAFGGVMGLSFVKILMSNGLLVPKARLIADFRDAGSIGRDTEIQLAGKSIGKVIDVEFITNRYPCNPETEDFGHPYQGRSDDCEPWMFCARDGADPEQGVCAELEEFSGRPSDYQGCDGPDSCAADQVCVTRAFRQRYRDVRWWGQAGWCVTFDPNSQRIRVDMEVDQSSLQYIRTDSRASIVLNGILADPRVNITVGASDEMFEEGARLQTTSSLMEDVLALKDQIDKIADDVDRGLLGVSALTDSLSDAATKANIAALRENVSEIQRQVRDAEGLVGAVLNDPDTRSEISQTLRETRASVTSVRAKIDELEGSAKRTMSHVDDATGRVERLLAGLDDPKNTSLLATLVNEDHGLRADAARVADGTQEAIGAGREAFADITAALDEIGQAIEGREGSLGRLIADPKPLYHIKDPATLRRVNVVKGLVRWVIEQDELQSGSARSESADSESEAAEPEAAEATGAQP
jgi:ABC-type transporter Mla subunit MlaD